MTTEWVYFAVMVVATVAVAGAIALVAWSDRWAARYGLVSARRWVPLAVAIAVFVAVGLALRWRTLAEADGRVVRRLAAARSDELDDAFTLLTTAGDTVPSYAIAASLAIAIVFAMRRVLAAWLLLLVVPVELSLQVLLADHMLPGVTIDEVEPAIVLGGAGSHPSGATARLLSVFLVSAALCRPGHPVAAQRLVVAAGVATIVEVLTRLYLGRHLVADIVGGAFVGAALAIVFGAVAASLAPLERRLMTS